ncbi:MAG: BlaI/MecI/CopY family transcriptional regulator [Planctomycetota bacterium]|jgi:predicted transcriptional regulator
MARHKTPGPTDRELAILRVLWQRGPSTVRQVNEAISADRSTGYTTTLKLMQIMTEKGLVVRDESDRTHVYKANVAEEQTQRQLVGDLMDRAFGGSARKLVMQALAAKKVSAGELTKIKQLLDELRED